MVRVHVAALILGIGHDHLGPVPAYRRHETADRLVQVGVGETVGVGVGLRPFHSRVAISEHHHFVVADHGRGPGQFLGSNLGQLLGHRGLVQRRVEDLALLSSRAAHQHGAHPLSVVTRHRGRALGRLVVGMGVNGEQAEPAGGSRHGR